MRPEKKKTVTVTKKILEMSTVILAAFVFRLHF